MKHFYLKFTIIFIGLLFAYPEASFGQGAAEKGSNQTVSEQSFFGNTLLFMVAGFLGYYMLVTRPQQLQEQDHKKIIEKIKKNDQVLISPGIQAKVVQVQDGEVTVDIGTAGSSVKVKVLPSAISLPAVESEERKAK